MSWLPAISPARAGCQGQGAYGAPGPTLHTGDHAAGVMPSVLRASPRDRWPDKQPCCHISCHDLEPAHDIVWLRVLHLTPSTSATFSPKAICVFFPVFVFLFCLFLLLLMFLLVSFFLFFLSFGFSSFPSTSRFLPFPSFLCICIAIFSFSFSNSIFCFFLSWSAGLF